MATPRQRTAQLRNFGKMRLAGVHAQLLNLKNSPVIANHHKQKLEIALHKVISVLISWDKDYVKKLSDEECKAIAKRGY